MQSQGPFRPAFHQAPTSWPYALAGLMLEGKGNSQARGGQMEWTEQGLKLCQVSTQGGQAGGGGADYLVRWAIKLNEACVCPSVTSQFADELKP